MSICEHKRWLLPPPNGPVSTGVCMDCGADETVRDSPFLNIMPSAGWAGNAAMFGTGAKNGRESHNHDRIARRGTGYD